MPGLELEGWDRVANEIGDYMTRSVLENFRTGGRPNRWQPLRSGEPSHLLDSGMLFASITYDVSRQGPDWVVKIGPKGVPYAAVHQFGYPARNIPQREYLVFQRQDKRWIGQRILKHIKSQLSGKP